MNTNKIALITGATSGIGKSCAEVFASNGFELIIAGRRAERLKEIKEQLENKYKIEVTALAFDVQSYEACSNALESLADDKKKISVLINNAGLSRGLSKINEGLISDWEEMINTNVKGLLYVTKIVSQWMVQNNAGHIINVGSTAAKDVYWGGNVYCATKHAVEAITKATRIDLIHQNIKVSAIHPGFVETEFSLVRFHGDAERAQKVYEGFQPLTPDDVANVIFYMASVPAHVNLADIVILPSAQASVGVVNKASAPTN